MCSALAFGVAIADSIFDLDFCEIRKSVIGYVLGEK